MALLPFQVRWACLPVPRTGCATHNNASLHGRKQSENMIQHTSWLCKRKVRPWGRVSACLDAGELSQPCSSSCPLSVAAPLSGQAAPQHTRSATWSHWDDEWWKCLYQPQRGAGAWQQQHFDPVHTSTPQFSHPVLSVETLRHVLLKWRHCTIWISVFVIQQPQCLVRIGIENKSWF